MHSNTYKVIHIIIIFPNAQKYYWSVSKQIHFYARPNTLYVPDSYSFVPFSVSGSIIFQTECEAVYVVYVCCIKRPYRIFNRVIYWRGWICMKYKYILHPILSVLYMLSMSACCIISFCCYLFFLSNKFHACPKLSPECDHNNVTYKHYSTWHPATFPSNPFIRLFKCEQDPGIL